MSLKAMRFGSGSYNVRDSEGLNPEALIRPSASLTRTIACRVFFLDGTEHPFVIPRQSRGQELLDRVYEYLELVEKDFFSLQFISVLDPREDTQQKKWLDPSKSVRKQMICPPYNLYFRVKFYVSDPAKLIEEYTRYHFFLQLRKDLLDGRIPCPENSLILLSSYAVQSEFGDYSLEDHGENYLDNLVIAPEQPADFAERVVALHAQHRGLCPADAEFAFLEHVKRLEMYGVELFECRDDAETPLAVGANAFGMVIFASRDARLRPFEFLPNRMRKVSEFPWVCIMKISFKRKQFSVDVRMSDENGREKESVLAFHVTSSHACKALWKSCVEHHTFFRLIAPPTRPPKGLFNLGSRYRYSGRTEFQTLEDVKRRSRVDRPFVRSSSKTSFARHTYNGGAGGGGGGGSSAGGSGTTPRSTDSSRVSDDSPDLSSRVYSRSGPSWARKLLCTAPGPSASSESPRRSRRDTASAPKNTAPATSTAMTEPVPGTSREYAEGRLSDGRTVEDVEADCEVVMALHKSTSLPSSSSGNVGGAGEIAFPTILECLHRHKAKAMPPPPPKMVVIVPPIPALADVRSLRSLEYDRRSARSLSPSTPYESSEEEDEDYTKESALRSALNKFKALAHGVRSLARLKRSRKGKDAPKRGRRSESSAPSLQRRSHVETTFGVERIPPSPYRGSASGLDSCDSSEARDYDTGMLGTQAVATTPLPYRSPMLTGGVRKSYYSGPPSSSSGQNGTIRNGYGNGHTTPNNGSSFAASTTNGVPVTRIAVSNPRNSPRLSAVIPSSMLPPPMTTLSNGGTNSQRSSVASYSSHVSGYGSSSTAANGTSPTRNRRSPQSTKSASPVAEDALVIVRMKPDPAGRFGFNVKGGADQCYPVIVSKVASGSAADRSHPRLNEGDQVILINGRDVSNLTHDQVVSFIRSARIKSGSGELCLTIKPNVYRCGEHDDEALSTAAVPPPAIEQIPESVPRSDRLAMSMRMIGEDVKSGRCQSTFDALHRKKPGMTMNDCQLPQNVGKNRYRDVIPYDATRVHLLSSNGDYINASYVNMDIPSSGIINRYIACQGPLAHTATDFWEMVWEQLCTTIVMLTTTVERGRVKCHQYWPRKGEAAEYGDLLVTCLKEQETKDCAYREFSLRDRKSREERRVTQMQYLSWPDHGVPDDPSQFIEFVSEVRKARAGSVDPIVVHCSAGIGRTGVLILMETAACLVEANEPVYPVEIVRTMRDQRAMLIQTTGQYTFVCESILRAFNDGTIKPLAEYAKPRS